MSIFEPWPCCSHWCMTCSLIELGGPGLTLWAGMFGVYCVGADMLIGGMVEAFTDD